MQIAAQHFKYGTKHSIDMQDDMQMGFETAIFGFASANFNSVYETVHFTKLYIYLVKI